MVLYTEKSTETFQMQFAKSDIDKDGMCAFKLGNMSTVPTQIFFFKSLEYWETLCTYP